MTQPLSPLDLALGTVAALRADLEAARTKLVRMRSHRPLGAAAVAAWRAEIAAAVAERERIEAAIAKAEQRAIIEALVETAGDRVAAMQLVGMPARTFYRKIPEEAAPSQIQPVSAIEVRQIRQLVREHGVAGAAAKIGRSRQRTEALTQKVIRGGKVITQKKA